jgi:hypothetical protein
VDGAVGRLASDSERLVYDINAVVSVVRFHRVVATRVDAALEALEECGLALPGSRESAQAELNLESGRLGALERHYTMESERRVHRKVVSREAPRAAAAPATGGGGSAEFGENVELF